MKKFYVAIGISLCTGFLPSSAFARRDSRDGFNFGTHVRFSSLDESRRANAINDRETSSNVSGVGYSPYIGYATSNFNIGLAGFSQSENISGQETNTRSGDTIDKTINTRTTGASLFARLLFGRVMYFELGAGGYSQTMSVNAEYKTAEVAGQFSGHQEAFKVTGTGPGYHLGMGLEIPMGNGFYFNSAYLLRDMQLRDNSDGSELGKQLASGSARALEFGFSHYLD